MIYKFCFLFSGATLKSDKFSGAKKLLLTVQMSKGKGALAQLFRTNLKPSYESSKKFQFRWIVYLKKDTS